MKLILKSILLLLVLVSVSFTDARHIVPLDFSMCDTSLDNPEAVLRLSEIVKVKAIFSGYDLTSVRIIGPFNHYYVDEYGEIELRYAEYNVVTGDGTHHKARIDCNADGSLSRSTSFSYGKTQETSHNWIIDEWYIKIGNDSLTYIVKASGIYWHNLNPYIGHVYLEEQYDDSLREYYSEAEASATKEIVSKYAYYLYELSKPQDITIDLSEFEW